MSEWRRFNIMKSLLQLDFHVLVHISHPVWIAAVWIASKATFVKSIVKSIDWQAYYALKTSVKLCFFYRILWKKLCEAS